MPPKKNTSKEPMYALIWFISTRERYIMDTIKLPKTRRKKGIVVKILWEDPNTKISQRYDVKIIKLDNDKIKLKNILLDEDGNVCDDNTKVFYRSVLDKKRELQKEAKKDITANKFQKNSLAHKIAQKKPLFDLTGKISNQQAGTCSNDTLQHHDMSAQNDEHDVSYSTQSSPVSTEKQKLNFTEKVISESNILNINTTDTTKVPQLQCSKTSGGNTVPATCENKKATCNDNKENVESLENPEVSVSDVNIGALHTFLPVTATEENLKFLSQIYAGLSAAYKHQQTNVDEKIKILKVDGQNKREISPRSGIFFPIEVVEMIEKRALTGTGVIDWKIIVKLALIEVYGDHLGNYCAVGRVKSSLRPSIDRDIYNAIFNWIQIKSTEKIDPHDYTTEVTAIIGNKRNSKIVEYSSIDTISRLDLQFFEKVISAVEKENQWHQESDQRLNLLNSTLRSDFLIPGPTKARIAEKYNIFFPKSAIAYIEKRTESPESPHLSDWKNLVKEALITVYGTNIGSFCAKGKLASRTPIHPLLYQAILAWANSRSDTKIDEGILKKHINQIAFNKRKTSKRKSTCETSIIPSQKEKTKQKKVSSPASEVIQHPSQTDNSGHAIPENQHPRINQDLSSVSEVIQHPSQTDNSGHAIPENQHPRINQDLSSVSEVIQHPSQTDNSEHATPDNQHPWINQDSKYTYGDNQHYWTQDSPGYPGYSVYQEDQYYWTTPNSSNESYTHQGIWTTQDRDQRREQSWAASPWQYSNPPFYTKTHLHATQNYNYNSPVPMIDNNNEVRLQPDYNDSQNIIQVDENRTLREF